MSTGATGNLYDFAAINFLNEPWPSPWGLAAFRVRTPLQCSSQGEENMSSRLFQRKLISTLSLSLIPYLWRESVWEQSFFDIISILSKIQSCLAILNTERLQPRKWHQTRIWWTTYFVLWVTVSMVKSKTSDDVSVLSECSHVQGSGANLTQCEIMWLSHDNADAPAGINIHGWRCVSLLHS